MRQGTKTALGELEICIVNGVICAEDLRDEIVTVWEFADEYARDVLAAVSMRSTWSATVEAELERPATRGAAEAHVPRCFPHENKLKRKAGEEAPPSWAGYGKVCAMRDDECAPCDPHESRPDIFCPGCHAYYHFACFFHRHDVCLKE